MSVRALIGIFLTCGLGIGPLQVSADADLNRPLTAVEIKGRQELSESAFRLYFNSIRSTRSVAIAAAFGGASTDSIRNLLKEIKTGRKSDELGETELKKDQIFYNGKKMGIRVASFFPFNIEIKGRMWAWDSKKLLDQNFFSLRTFLQDASQTSIMNLFFNFAFADDDLIVTGFTRTEALATIAGTTMGSYAAGGASIGSIGAAFGPVTLAGGMGIGAIGGVIVGGTQTLFLGLKAYKEENKRTREDLKSLAEGKANLKLSCDDRGATFRIFRPGQTAPSTDIRIWPNSKVIQINKYQQTKMDKGNFNYLMATLGQCKNKATAKKLLDESNERLKTALKAIYITDGSLTTTPQSEIIK